jgi:hypothetical protein
MRMAQRPYRFDGSIHGGGALDNTSSRLDRARSQYEDLLLNARGIVDPSAAEASAAAAGYHGEDEYQYPYRSSYLDHDNMYPHSLPSERYDVVAAGQREDELFVLGLEDEGNLVISLQNEIDRLKLKLNSVLEAAERSCEEFQRSEVCRLQIVLLLFLISRL